MKLRFSVLMASILQLTACASYPTLEQVEESGYIGMEAYLAGQYALADEFLTVAIEGNDQRSAAGEKRHSDETLWEHAYATLLWEQERNYELLDFAEQRLTEAEADFWFCAAMERHEHLWPASDCFQEIGEFRRARRASRSAIFRDVFFYDR